MREKLIFSLSLLMLAGAAKFSNAEGTNVSQQIQMLNSQIQAQIQRVQADGQTQMKTLNTQLQAQIKKVQMDLQAQIQKVNSQTQDQLKQMQANLDQMKGGQPAAATSTTPPPAAPAAATPQVAKPTVNTSAPATTTGKIVK